MPGMRLERERLVEVRKFNPNFGAKEKVTERPPMGLNFWGGFERCRDGEPRDSSVGEQPTKLPGSV